MKSDLPEPINQESENISNPNVFGLKSILVASGTVMIFLLILITIPVLVELF